MELLVSAMRPDKLEFECVVPDANMRPLRIRKVLEEVELLPSDCVILRIWVGKAKVYDHEN